MTAPVTPFVRMTADGGGQAITVVSDRFEGRRMTISVDHMSIFAITPAAARALIATLQAVLQEVEAGEG